MVSLRDYFDLLVDADHCGQAFGENERSRDSLTLSVSEMRHEQDWIDIHVHGLLACHRFDIVRILWSGRSVTSRRGEQRCRAASPFSCPCPSASRHARASQARATLYTRSEHALFNY